MCAEDYHALERSSVVWKCFVCDSLNCDSFTFHSYELQVSNSFSPLSFIDSSIDSVHSNVFSPLHASSPRTRNNSEKTSNRHRESSTTSNQNSTNPYPDLPGKQNLRILNINCRSVKENNAEFKTAVNYIKPDIICGTESWLKGIKPGLAPSSNHIKNSEIFSSSYNVFRNDRGTRGGGVFIAVNNNLTAIECIEFITECEVEFAKITLQSKKLLYVGCFYMPKRNMDDINRLAESLKRLNSSKPKHLILCGDFNCPDINWDTLSISNLPNVQDRSVQQHLIDTMNENNLVQIHEEPTREENLLDLVFTTNPSLIKSSVNAPGISDHAMVIVDSDIRPVYNRQKPRKIYQFRKANWDAIKADCSNISSAINDKLSPITDIEELWSIFRDDILSSINKHIPSKTCRNKHTLPWVDRNLRKTLKKKARLYKYAKTHNSWSKYRHFQKECKRQFRKAEWNHVNKVIEEGLQANNTKPFWKYVKSKKQDNIGTSPLKQKGNLVTDAKEKANILVEQFQSVFTKDADSSKPKVNTKKKLPSIQPLRIETKGVQKLLENLNIAKAMGPDSIPNLVLKTCAAELSQGLRDIYQHSVDTGKLPSDWRNAFITPAFKKGDRHVAENYRPVSLTSVPCKLLEHIICSHIMKFFEHHNILTKLNHGFRSGFSTESQLLVTLQDLLKSFDKKQQVDVAILDFSKAFDTVPHNKLLHKLDCYGIRGELNDWLTSFLTERVMDVVCEGEHSKSVRVDSGVPQGTVLGPLLFLVHINDLPEQVRSQVRLFADDCLLYRTIRTAKDHSILQNDLLELEKWASTWGMRFNAKKCYILSIRNKSSNFYQLNNTFLQQVPCNPYLGITISEDLQWGTHINNICKKANSTLGFLRRNLRNCPQECRRLAYISLVRSTLEYGSNIWDPYLAKDVNAIEKIQRQAARFIKKDYKSREEGSVTRMLQELNLPTLQQRREFNRLTYLFKLVEGMVPAIDICDYLVRQKPKRRVKPVDYKDCVTQNILTNQITNNSKCYIIDSANSDQYKNSFFVRTVVNWNKLDESTTSAQTVEAFKTGLEACY